MNRLIKAFLRYPTLTVILAALAVMLGIRSLIRMPRTEDPTITIRTGIVAAAYPGATSEQVEKQVTKTLEAHIFKFQEVRKDKTYSTSRPGTLHHQRGAGEERQEPGRVLGEAAPRD